MHIEAQGYALPIDSALIDILKQHLQLVLFPHNQLVVLQFRDPPEFDSSRRK